MARQTEYGTYIISAGEVGSYTVCPEAWRLKSIKRVKRAHSDSVDAGEKLHREWANNFDEAVYLTRHVKMTALLIILTVILYALT